MRGKNSAKLACFHYSLVRFFFGKNNVMTIALGKDKEAEYKENLHKIANVSVCYMPCILTLILCVLLLHMCRNADNYKMYINTYILD